MLALTAPSLAATGHCHVLPERLACNSRGGLAPLLRHTSWGSLIRSRDNVESDLRGTPPLDHRTGQVASSSHLGSSAPHVGAGRKHRSHLGPLRSPAYTAGIRAGWPNGDVERAIVCGLPRRFHAASPAPRECSFDPDQVGRPLGGHGRALGSDPRAPCARMGGRAGAVLGHSVGLAFKPHWALARAVVRPGPIPAARGSSRPAGS